MIELSDTGDHLASWTFAGDALNWATAVSNALPNADVKLLSAVGDDERSAEFSAFCSTLGVNASPSPVLRDRNMGIYWISTVNGDRRFRYWRAESAAREHLRSAPRILPIEAPNVVMFSNITLAVAGANAIQFLGEIAGFRADGSTVVYDSNFRPQLWPDAKAARSIEASAFELADHVHASLDDVSALWGQSRADFLAQLSAADVAEALITDGAGEVVVSHEGSTTAIQPRTVEPIDTSGAGDAFFGTYLGRRLAGASIAQAVEAAADVCAQVVSHPGALTYRFAGDSASPETPG